MTQACELLKCERCAVFLLDLEEGNEEVRTHRLENFLFKFIFLDEATCRHIFLRIGKIFPSFFLFYQL